MPMSPEDIARLLVRDRDRYVARIWGLIHDFDQAEDLFQAICVDVVQQRESIADETHLARWIHQAARFRAIDVLRRRESRPMVFDTDLLDLIDSEWDAQSHEQSQQTRRAMRHCLDQLTPKTRELIHLRYVRDLKGRTLAEHLGRKPNAVFVALSRAHRALSDCIRARLRLEEAADA
ncbi:sigma-70 family RNA polymerase sigma factor [Planctomycetales bacterium ZRK34]|nr:sigma-70 family RNA polymerase sigma factor [Planctomycetales bacterium ZRK34]